MANDIQHTITTFYQDLSPSEKKIADYLMQHQERAAKSSIQDLSQAVDLSTATISRFAKRLGYQSFPELKIALSMPTSDTKELFSDLSRQDDSLTLAKKVFAANIRSLEDTENFLEQSQLDAALTILTQAKQAAFFGLGGSQVVALDAFHKFIRTSLPCEFQNDYHMQLMLASKLTANDCAIVISHTGRNQEILHLCELLEKNHVPIICITSYAASPLAQAAKVALIAFAEETAYRSEAMSAMQAQFSLIDCLFMLYSVTNYEANSRVRQQIRDAIKETRI